MQHSVTKRGTRISTGINYMTDSSDGELYSDTVYLDAVNRDDEKQWNDKVLVETNPVPFKVDTGAEVTALIVRRYI